MDLTCTLIKHDLVFFIENGKNENSFCSLEHDGYVKSADRS